MALEQVKDEIRLMNLDETAKMFRRSRQSIRRWCRLEGLPYHKVGNTLLFRVDEVMKWLEQRKVQ